MTSNKNKAFTLIELSIVIVIIGLIITGVLTGQELIRGANVKSLVSQIGSFNAAISSFYARYGSLPGDMINATSFIPNTYNGNGDGFVGRVNGSNSTYGGGGQSYWATQAYENQNAWQHLYSTGLINQVFTTAVPSSTNYPTLNCPSGTLPTVSYNNNICILLYGNYSSISATNFYMISQMNINVGGSPQNYPVSFSPSDAFAFDSKIDDGSPYSGVVVARNTLEQQAAYTGSLTLSSSYPTGCVVGINSSTAGGYNTAAPSSSLQCNLRVNLSIN